MNVRTIQHPGIEIRETDLTEYRDTVTTNNAYVIGFADRGPIYDYSWVTTQSEFIKLYGQPQTEAEKYLFYAVQSILNNGGTPLVARMPYDNKQCKAYKALKIKYASLDMQDENPVIINWSNDVNLTASASALIDLKKIASNLSSNANTLEDVFKNYKLTTIDDNPTTINYQSLTFNDLLINLNTVSSKILTDDDIQKITPLQNKINNVENIETYLTVAKHDRSINAVKKLENYSTISGETVINDISFDTLLTYYNSKLVSGMLTIPNEVLAAEKITDFENKIYDSSKSAASYLNIIKQNLQEEINVIKNPTVISFKINDKMPADLLIPSAAVNNAYNILSGKLSNHINESLSGFTNTEKNIVSSLMNIYNDPFFHAFDDSLSGQAIIDANLLIQDAIGYKYGVFLDSKECDISNEQYDDLVTTNKFSKADTTVSKYGEDIDTANFIIVDKQKTVVDGTGNNEGYFVTIIDPFDALKMQRLLVNPNANAVNPQTYDLKQKAKIDYWGKNSVYNWKTMFKTCIDNLDCLQRVKNADGIWVGEVSEDMEKSNLLDSWSVPLSADYYSESISKNLMNLFSQIPLTDVASNMTSSMSISTIDKQYSSHIVVAVCKTVVNPSDGKITISVLESFFGSLFDERNIQNGRTLYIGDLINANSNYIEFYRNNYIKPKFGAGYDPSPYDRTAVPQFFIKDSMELKNAVQMVGIDTDSYDVNNIYTQADGTLMANRPGLITHSYNEYIAELRANNIFIFDKKTTVFYNNHPEAEFCSFSKKESQKIIANTTGLYSQEEGTTANIGDNFIIDMDRCIQFIKNVDDIPMYFVVDAGLSTIAQFCDNVVWDEEAKKWVTQQFDPDNDPDAEDRYITDYTDVSTWRKVVDKLDQISREIRRDCMTIIDAPRQLTLDGAAQKIRRSKPSNNFDELIGDKLIYISGINSSYTAGYYNWLRTTDTYTGKSFWLPPTCKIIGNLCYLNIINLPWLAPAGLNYGIVNGIHGVSHNPGSTEEDIIYQKSWNYVKQYPFDGFIIEGQKTTLTKNSAFNRINVRLLFLDLERYVYNVARNFKYQVNNQYTREQFVQTIKPKFEDYLIRGGLYDYLIKCDGTNNTAETIDQQELRCAIYLKPARLIEFILVDFIATKSGANFEEIVT